jgi:hypothetical protein
LFAAADGRNRNKILGPGNDRPAGESLFSAALPVIAGAGYLFGILPGWAALFLMAGGLLFPMLIASWGRRLTFDQGKGKRFSWEEIISRYSKLLSEGYSIKEEHVSSGPAGEFISWIILKDGRENGYIRLQVKDRTISVRELYPHLPSGDGYGMAVLLLFLIFHNRWPGYKVRIETSSPSCYKMLLRLREIPGLGIKINSPWKNHWLANFTVPFVEQNFLLNWPK